MVLCPPFPNKEQDTGPIILVIIILQKIRYTAIPFGKYVCKKFNIESKPVNSKITYPGLYLVKTAQEAYETNKAEIGVSTNTATEGTKIENALKEWAGGNSVLISVTETITEMFEYIGNCSQPTDITYENYLKSAPV
jgi:hypothetical protein